jgi:hypothetical protein
MHRLHADLLTWSISRIPARQDFKALRNVLVGSVDRYGIAGPSLIVPPHGLIPSYRDVDDTCFDATTMFMRIGTQDLDLDGA